MAYVDQFIMPEFAKTDHYTSAWTDWLDANRMIHDFAPRVAGSCTFCGGSLREPDRYSHCYTCNNRFAPNMSHLLAASYSFDNGIESLLHRFKDGSMYAAPEYYSWHKNPLASLLAQHFFKHRACVESVVGSDATFTWVPSDDTKRPFDHIKEIVHTVPQLAGLNWVEGLIVRDREHPRPARQELSPASYAVTQNVQGHSIVLVDDVWTSGASIGSAAAALRLAGARTVVGLVIGRQLNRTYTAANNQEIVESVENRRWTNGACSICA